MLRAAGATVQVVEKWNPHARIRQDLFGVIDLISLESGQIWGVQATSGTNHSARVKKSMEEPKLHLWLACGGRFKVISWRKSGSKWIPRTQIITLQ
jgi:hypothetical protein